jgi:hypothetical protein
MTITYNDEILFCVRTKKEVYMASQYLFRDNIADQMVSLSEFVNVNRQDNNWQFMSVQSLESRNILFIQGYEGGDDDDPIVPPN